MTSNTSSPLKLFLSDFILEHLEFKGVIVYETFDIELEEINQPQLEWEGINCFLRAFSLRL
jgi:hypothetical protein